MYKSKAADLTARRIVQSFESRRQNSETEAKVSVAVTVILVLLAFVDLRISAALATAYLVAYGVNGLRKKRRGSAERVAKSQ